MNRNKTDHIMAIACAPITHNYKILYYERHAIILGHATAIACALITGNAFADACTTMKHNVGEGGA